MWVLVSEGAFFPSKQESTLQQAHREEEYVGICVCTYRLQNILIFIRLSSIQIKTNLNFKNILQYNREEEEEVSLISHEEEKYHSK